MIALYISGGFLILLSGVIFAAFRWGKNSNESHELKENLKTIDKAKEVENEISGLNDDDITKRLSKWRR